MASKIYAFDDFGIKHETMSRTEIENAIQTGEINKEVFEGSIEYEGENVPYSYVGTKLDDAIILKLLACGISPYDNALIPSEIQTYLSLPIFAIHFYYSETEIYATNAKNAYLGFEKIGIGTCKVYPSGQVKTGYYMKSSKKMNDVRYCETKTEYDDIVKDENTTYIVEDENYTVDYALEADNAKKAKEADYATYPRAITGDTEFYTCDQDMDYLGLSEPNFVLSDVFALDEEKSDTSIGSIYYLPKVKNAVLADTATNATNATKADNAQYADEANLAILSDKLKAYSDTTEIKLVTDNALDDGAYIDVNCEKALLNFDLQVYYTGYNTGTVYSKTTNHSVIVGTNSSTKVMTIDSFFMGNDEETGTTKDVALVRIDLTIDHTVYDNVDKFRFYIEMDEGYIVSGFASTSLTSINAKIKNISWVVLG